METITMGHGSGGRLSAQLIDSFRDNFKSNILNEMLDSAKININDTKLAFTTDSYVIKPIFFTGGDIGKLSVCGTVNDLSVSGAVPKYISLSFIIEEGFKFNDLNRIIDSINKTANMSGVQIVTGDTKVVEKNACDGIFINTSGIGILDNRYNFSYSNIKEGDCIILNGTIGDHTATIMSLRENMGFKSDFQSDCAPLNDIIFKVLDAGCNIKLMKDVTRGGLSAVLYEIAGVINKVIELEEEAIPVNDNVKSFSEILGIDPINMANEGKFITIVDKADADKVLKIMQKHEQGKNSSIVGFIGEELMSKVIMKTLYGTKRIVQYPLAEKLPRIC